MEGEGLSLKQRDKYQLNGRNGESNGAARRSIGQATARGNGVSQLNHEDQQYLNVVIHVISAEIMMLTASEEWNKRVAMRPKKAGGRAELITIASDIKKPFQRHSDHNKHT